MSEDLREAHVTFFTDIEGRPALGDGTVTFGSEHGRLIEDACAARSGQIIDTQGDAYFAAFDRARSSAAAVNGQRTLGRQMAGGLQLRVRIGLTQRSRRS